jgi:phosphoserine phosphatase
MNDIKLVVFDINDTLITTHSWEAFNVALGMTPEEDLTLWRLNEEGVLSNRHWVEVVNALYQKRGTPTKKLITDTLLEFEYMPHAKELVAKLKQKYEVALISGAPDLLVEHIAKDLDIDMFGSNALLGFDAQDVLEEMVVLSNEPESKVIYLQAFCRRLGISENQVVAIGDGSNDIELFKRTGHGITFQDSKIKAHAWKTVDSLQAIEDTL